MKHVLTTCLLMIASVLAGCSTSQSAQLTTPFSIPDTQTSTAILKSTLTDTTVPTSTGTPTPTAYLTSTPTLINSVLAKSGYDVANVRLSFPREYMVFVDFQYRLAESRKSKNTYIYMTIPLQCRDDINRDSPPQYVARDLVGDVHFEFKYTLQGNCSTDTIEFTFYPDPNRNAQSPLYREYVQQSYHLVRNFPTVNSDTVKVENIQFTARPNWSGLFTFTYAVSEQIPFPLEQYRFGISGFGPGGTCFFASTGPLLIKHSGEYSMALYLSRDFGGPNQNCLKGLNTFTYTTVYLTVQDEIAGTVYQEPLDLSFTVAK